MHSGVQHSVYVGVQREKLPAPVQLRLRALHLASAQLPAGHACTTVCSTALNALYRRRPTPSLVPACNLYNIIGAMRSRLSLLFSCQLRMFYARRR